MAPQNGLSPEVDRDWDRSGGNHHHFISS